MKKTFEITLEDERIKELKNKIKTIKPITRRLHNKVSGYHITFGNNWLISIQFSAGNYCDFHLNDFFENIDYSTSTTAEIAYWKINENGSHGEMQQFEESSDTVLGYQTWEQVYEWMKKISEMESE